MYIYFMKVEVPYTCVHVQVGGVNKGTEGNRSQL